MLTCHHCGTSTVEVARYCPKCGTMLQRDSPGTNLALRLVGAILATIGLIVLGAVGACFGAVFGSAAGDFGSWAGICGAVLIAGWLWFQSMRSIFR